MSAIPGNSRRTSIAAENSPLRQKAERERWERPGIKGWIVCVVASALRIPALSASRFRFYEHLPPKRPCEEDFGRVKMSFRRGRFTSPRWRQYEVIPQTIASVRRELKHDVEVRPSWM